MYPSRFHFFPLALPFVLALFLLVVFLVAFIEVGILGYAYEKVGVDRRWVFTLLMLSLAGSGVNIPVAELPAERVLSGDEIVFFGMRYVIPVVENWPRTVIAVNVGGAVIPTLLSLYLVVKNGLWVTSLAGIGVVAAVVHAIAQPVRGVGIAVPTFVPPLVAATAALAMSRGSAPALAYVAGSLGTLIGADLLNLGRIRGLGAPIASIGGGCWPGRRSAPPRSRCCAARSGRWSRRRRGSTRGSPPAGARCACGRGRGAGRCARCRRSST